MATPRPQAEPSKQFETDRVIVTQWRFPPGAETGWHRHGYDYVVIPLTTGSLMLESAEGEKTAELKAGRSYARSEGVEHNVINANDFEFSFIEVELKP
ncbi:MAG: cupin domain-containing protein [Gammaproteobacteria bacterium]|nr:cupin domain-containing protein [Gammaproteobacteria bacterium]MCZ6895870.1 cupin domain-containing protein [Gammaproteobacteria bacterium]